VEENQLVAVHDYCVNFLPKELANQFTYYVTEALRQNATHELLTHEYEDWKNTYSYRYGAESVMGTAREFLAAVCLAALELDVLFIHNEHEQVDLGRDLLISSQTRRYSMSVKSKAMDKYGGVRLGREFFMPLYDIDVLALVDFNTMDVEFYVYSQMRLLFWDCRCKEKGQNGPNDIYWYAPPSTFEKHVF
jgi:hypothetical protein